MLALSVSVADSVMMTAASSFVVTFGWAADVGG
jgi:hypothetical protein